MYYDLDRIDVIAGPYRIQTDDRTRAEIEQEPELSVLFALSRVRSARLLRPEEIAAMPASSPHKPIIYGAYDVPAFLAKAVAAAGGVIQDPDTNVQYAPPCPVETMSELADRAFAGLAERARRRLAAPDLIAALRTLENETLASPPMHDETAGPNVDADDDDRRHYWARVCELSALAGEILRSRHGGAWTEIEEEEVDTIPFGFQLRPDCIVLPSNSAHRVIHSGQPQMLRLLALATLQGRPPDDNPNERCSTQRAPRARRRRRRH